jgi:uncharacterized membrane protein
MKIHTCKPLMMALVMVTLTGAQAQTDATQRNVHRLRYKLVDLGTLGGPTSADVAAPVINNRRVITGGADTAESDPNAPNCYSPDCFVMHAYKWRRGVLRDLGTLSGGFGGEGNWINERNEIAGLDCPIFCTSEELV